jgi:hypothetical protein
MTQVSHDGGSKSRFSYSLAFRPLRKTRMRHAFAQAAFFYESLFKLSDPSGRK